MPQYLDSIGDEKVGVASTKNRTVLIAILMLVVPGPIALAAARQSEKPPAWILDLKSPDSATRGTGLRALEERLRTGDMSAPVIGALLDAGDETDHVLRMHVVDLAGLVQPGAVPLLVQALGSRDPVRRGWSAEILGVVGPPARSARPRLIELLKDKDERVRDNAGFAIGRIDRDTGTCIPALAQMLKSERLPERRSAARALDQYGSSIRISVAILLDALADEDEGVRYWLVCVLGNLGPGTEGVLPALISILQKDPSSFVAERAAVEMGQIGPPASEAIPALKEALGRREAFVMREAALALLQIGVPADDVAPALIARLRSEKLDDQRNAAEVLGRMQTSVKEVVPALVEALENSQDLLVRIESARTLGVMWRDAAPAVPALRKCSQQKDANLAAACRDALAAID